MRAGRVSESAALTTVLQAQGVTAAHTKAAPSEALLFGIAGGIGGAYWVFDYKEIPYPLLSVFTRHAWDSSRRFIEGPCTRLGLTHTFKETTSAATAEKTLRDALAAGHSPILWVSRALAIDNDLPKGLDAAASYVVVARRVDEAGGKYEVIDRTRVVRWVEREELARVRALVRSDKQRLLTIEPPKSSLLADGALQAAVEAGLAACARELIGPPPLPAMAAPNSGLTGLEKLAHLLGDTKDKRGWLTLFPPGLPLYKGLTGFFRAIEIDGSGGALRPLFADFLEEAAVILERRALLDAAALYRVLGDEWSKLALAALPDVVPLLAEARTLLLAHRDAFNARGSDAADEIQALDAQLETVQARARDSFPLDDRAARSLLTALSEQASLVVHAERGAVEALRIVLT